MIIDLFNSLEDLGDTIQVRVTPKASSNRIKVDYQSDGSKIIRVYVTVAPEDGNANKEVIKLLAKELGLPKSALTITHGLKIREKTIQITK